MSLPWPDLTSDEWHELVARKPKKKALTRQPDSSIIDLIDLGGPGSGNFGHAGRPGEVGGSSSEGDGGGDGTGGDSGAGSRAASRATSRLPLRENPTPNDFIEARSKSTRLGYLSPLTPDDLKDQTLYLTKDGTVGGAMTKDGDMGNLFNNGGPKGAAHEVLLDMIQDGGKTADAFDGYLPTLYANFGLQETGRMKFNPEYAPPGWNFERDDHPDVVFLSRTGEAIKEAGDADAIRGRVKDKGQWITPKRSTKYYDDYDEAKRDALANADAGGTRTLSALRDGAWRGVGQEAWGDGVGGSSRTGRPVGLTYREKLAYLLGGEGSGNFGHAGRPGEVGGSAEGDGPLLAKGPSSRGKAKGANRPLKVGMRAATEDDMERMKALKLPVTGPKAWKHIHIAESPTADLQATGIDVAGETQYRYTAKHTAESDAEKFARGKEFNEAVPTLRSRIRHDLHDESLTEKERESALMLDVIDKTAFRPGSEKETRLGAKKAYGITTLEGRHVKVDGDKVRFRFRGKSGVLNAKTITDRTLAKELAPRVARTGPNQQLFPTASDQDLRDYLHSRDGDFKPKDFRTWHGTTTAMKVIGKMKVPKTDKEFKKAQLVVAKVVSAHLGNEPATALKSYIDPAVWAPWKVKS